MGSAATKQADSTETETKGEHHDFSAKSKHSANEVLVPVAKETSEAEGKEAVKTVEYPSIGIVEEEAENEDSQDQQKSTKLSDEEVLNRTKVKLKDLDALDAPWDEDGTLILQYLLKKYYVKRKRKVLISIGDAMIENNFLEVCVRIWDFCHSADNENSFFLKSRAYILMKLVMWNYSDKCANIAKGVYDNKQFLERCMREFSLSALSIDSLKINRKRFLLKATFGILLNVVRLYNQNSSLIRADDGIQRILKYYNSTYLIIKAKVMMLLSYCINEEESETIMTGMGVIEFIVKLLKNALESPNHVGKTYAFSVTETIMSLDKLAANDNNKKLIVEAGILPLLTDVLAETCSVEEHSAATHCLWTLSFHSENKAKIREESGLLEAIHRLLLNPDVDPRIKRSCDGIVFIIERVQPREKTKKKRNNKQHIMISYQWDVQQTILEVGNRLKESGYKVWIDVEEMEDSILSSMANAVENASVVVVAMTEKYKNSNPCRTEAEYAYKLSKPIVPLLLQSHYKPDGWLGAFLGMQLYVDLTQSDLFEKKFIEVTKKIASKLESNSMSEHIVSETVVDAAPLYSIPNKTSLNTDRRPTTSKTCSKWTPVEVVKWTEECGIGDADSVVKGFDGVALFQLLQLLKRCPDIYYTSLKVDYQLNWLQIFHFTNALEKLS